MKQIIMLFAMGLGFQPANAQPGKQITIGECYQKAVENYPLVKQRALIEQARDYSIDNASAGWLPQVNINAQASYQSDVTQIPIKLPNVHIPELSKDQYKVYGDVNQVVYDGGQIRLQKQTVEATANVERQKLETELYKLRERVNQVFFGILVIDEQLKQNELLQHDIQLGIDKMTGAYKNGTALKSSVDMLKAELLTAGQRATELAASRKGYMDMLGQLIGEQLDNTAVLVRPGMPAVNDEINRPELSLYESQLKAAGLRMKTIEVRKLPRINLFLQGGYGRPALNMLSNDLAPYAIGGIRFNWSLSAFYTDKENGR